MAGWDDLETPAYQKPFNAPDPRTDFDRVYLRLFSTEDGKAVLAHLRSMTIEQPAWVPGMDASHGFAREGQDSLVREIEARMRRAMELKK
jgi:hypothetical protein